MTALSTLLDTFRAAGKTERERGTYFEELIVAYLRTEPLYKELYATVEPYADTPCGLIPPHPAGARFELAFDDPQWAVTPGQSSVLYDGDVCLGGGIITEPVCNP
jgi:tRNA U34 2-thiouridine synthase MnmA/TrmU